MIDSYEDSVDSQTLLDGAHHQLDSLEVSTGVKHVDKGWDMSRRHDENVPLEDWSKIKKCDHIFVSMNDVREARVGDDLAEGAGHAGDGMETGILQTRGSMRSAVLQSGSNMSKGVEAVVATDHCQTHLWYPAINCQGSPYLIRWGHDLLGERWSCLEHAIHAIRQIPDLSIIESPDPTFSDELRVRALTPRL